MEREDEQIVAAFVAEDSSERLALIDWAAAHGIDTSRIHSDAAILRLLLRVGAARLREQILDAEYAEFAANQTAEQKTETAEARRRYIARTEATSAATTGR